MSMTLLRRGITGFDAESAVDFRQFKQAIYVAAQECCAKVVAVVAGDGVTPNFHRVDVDFGARQFCVLCNRHLPIVAFAERPVEVSGVRPMNVPEFVDVLRLHGFEIATTEELLRPLERRDFVVLSPSERHQTNYWKPNRVVDLVFNWWD